MNRSHKHNVKVSNVQKYTVNNSFKDKGHKDQTLPLTMASNGGYPEVLGEGQMVTSKFKMGDPRHWLCCVFVPCS